MRPESYLLPNSTTNRRLDRFSLLDDEHEGDDGLVSFWSLFESILKSKIASSGQLIELLDTISNIIRESSGTAGDYGTLRGAVDSFGPDFFSDIWPKIVHHGLQLSTYFPEGRLEILQPGSILEFTEVQVATLVAHQFLCTLDCPPWRDGYFDFSIWYSSAQRHPDAAQMYLRAVFEYFRQLDEPGQWSDAPSLVKVVYSMHAQSETSLQTRKTEHVQLQPMHIQIVDYYDTRLQELSYQTKNGAVVISANKDIGFGQSATQEEVYVGNCPEACPAVLVTPTLQSNETLTITGASPMLHITGQRRDINWRVLPNERRRGGRMLFMDALEIDELDDTNGLPDLQSENIERELRKACTAFSSWKSTSSTVSAVYAGVWGCGAFHGDPGVKVMIMWMAASLAGRKLTIICDSSHGNIPKEISQLLDQIPSHWTVQDAKMLLNRIDRGTKRLETVAAMMSQLKYTI
ncbi:hypothetical protein CC79DRAFT_1055383 [Sarocladium strictum]